MNIILLDGLQSRRLSTTSWLEGEGHSVYPVQDVGQAMSLIRHLHEPKSKAFNCGGKIGVAIIQFDLRPGNGLTAALALRTIEKAETISIILVAHQDLENLEEIRHRARWASIELATSSELVEVLRRKGLVAAAGC